MPRSKTSRSRGPSRRREWTVRLLGNRLLLSTPVGEPSIPGQPARPGEEGSAVVEFVFLAVLLMIPVVYLVLTVGQLQGGAYAAVGAADQAAKVFASSSDGASARAAADAAVELAVADIGLTGEQAALLIACSPADCLTPGSTVTATVRITVPLPLVPTLPGLHLEAATLEASASQQVGRYR
jgi:hypothetical protein